MVLNSPRTKSRGSNARSTPRSEEHTSELQSRGHLVCRLLLEKKTPTNSALSLVLPPAFGRTKRSYSHVLDPRIPPVTNPLPGVRRCLQYIYCCRHFR